MTKSSRLFMALLVASTWIPLQANAAFFEDDEARRSILDLRAKVKEVEAAKADKSSMIELSNHDEALRNEIAKLRGQIEELTNQITTLESRQKDFYLDLDNRLRKQEPQQVNVDGKDVVAGPNENEIFNAAEAKFKAANYKGAIMSYNDFLKHFPTSGLAPNAQHQLGNAYYLLGDYKNALKNQIVVTKKYHDSQVVPDAMLNMASCQIGLKNIAVARKTLSALIKKYPKSDAAKGARERLAQIK